jgi:regulatory protein
MGIVELKIHLHVQKEQTLTKEQALQKARHFCAYQERCHQEVKDKLYGYGLHRQEVDESLSQLIEENYLNEERFAIHFAGGKFRMKHWGRNKIRFELKKRNISEYCIRKAMQAIDSDQYLQILRKTASNKWHLLRAEKNMLKKKHKVITYLVQKGFEADIVRDVLKEIEE